MFDMEKPQIGFAWAVNIPKKSSSMKVVLLLTLVGGGIAAGGVFLPD